ncbi:MAG: o-succinylbenzoate synthase [Candidatus Geothermarchaeales archaeon]
MEIEEIALRLVEAELKREFVTSFGRERNRQAMILEVSGEGNSGYGECVAGSGPWYSYETLQTAWHITVDYIAPAVLEKRVQSPRSVLERIGRIRGHNMAKAAVEMALWDLYAKRKGVSLSEALGGEKDRVQSGVSVGIQDDVDSLLGLIGGYLDEGYTRIKFKIRPGRDVKTAEAVRDRFPEVPMMVDANGAYTLEQSHIFRTLDRYDLTMMEQPLGYDDLSHHAKLQKEIKTPICLDESIPTLHRAYDAVALHSCRIVNIKPGRVGGHIKAKSMAEYLHRNHIRLWVGGMLETGIGRAHNVALASLKEFTLPNDISASDRYYEEDVVEPSFTLEKDGTIVVPRGVGLGVEASLDRLDEMTVKRETLKP